MIVTEKDLCREYEKKVLAWVDEQAKNPEVTKISFSLPSSSMDIHPSDTNGWDCDWWGEENVELGGSMWRVYGNAWNGFIVLTREDEDEDEEEWD